MTFRGMQESPYQAPEVVVVPRPATPASIKPGTLTTFGVIHLVMAGLGIATVLWGTAAQGNPNMFMGADEQNPMEELMHEVAWATWLSHGFMLILAVLLIISGIKMLKGKRDALRWSNRYAWASLGTKFASFVIALLFVAPVFRRAGEVMMQQIGQEVGAVPGMDAGLGWVSTLMVVLAVITPVIACVYPVLVLMLTNRQPVKDWLANHGS